MMYDAYAMQNDVMMLCYEKKVFIPELHTHIPAIKYIIFCVSALTFRCKLCIPLGTSLELLRLLLLAESALTFRCKLCIPLGTSLELLSCFFPALDGAFSAFTFTSLGDFALIELKKEITCDGPIKNLSPPSERKRVPWKKKKLHQVIHNIAEAHPHSKI
jgi:hypothetical protein